MAQQRQHDDVTGAAARITGDASLFMLDNEGIFFSAAGQELQHFNAPAAYVWCCLEEGFSTDEIVSGYAEAFGVTRATAGITVTDLLHRWQGLGYIDGLNSPAAHEIEFTTALARLLTNPSLRGEFAASPADTAKRLALRGDGLDAFVALDPEELDIQARSLVAKKRKIRHKPSELGNATTVSFLSRLKTRDWSRASRMRHYRCLSTEVCLRFETAEQEEWVHSILAHLEAEGATEPDVTLDIIDEVGGYVVLQDGVPIGSCDRFDQVARLAMALVRDIAINRSRFFMQIHAGAVGSDDSGCILLPAAPGGGKSTLTTALIGSGFHYLTDEIALLEEKTLNVRAAPFAIAVKPGSVEPLRNYFPEIAGLPLHYCDDTPVVRYLKPPAGDGNPSDESSWPVRSIVFPRYAPDAATALNPLPKAEALSRLMEECLVIPRDLDSSAVADLIGWIRGVACYELPFSSLSDAVGLIRTLR